MPLLAAEVVSPEDTFGKIVEKADEYLRAGVQLVWIIDPSIRSITVCRQGQEHRIVRFNEELTGEDVLPGFTLPARHLFRLPVM